MGLFGGKERKRQAFVQKVEDLAGSLQMEFVKSSVSFLEKKYDHGIAVKISAALANYVFRFGHVSPQHASDTDFMAIHLRRHCQAKAFRLRLTVIWNASAHRLSQTPSERPCATSATIPYSCTLFALRRSTDAKSQPSLATSRLVLAQPPATVPDPHSLPSFLGAFRKG